MPVFEIPITADDPAFKIRTVLEDVQVVLGFTWNERDERWQISVSDPNEAPLLMGCPLNINWEIFNRFEIPGLPIGSLMLFDTSGKNQEAGRDDLGVRCKLIYKTLV